MLTMQAVLCAQVHAHFINDGKQTNQTQVNANCCIRLLRCSAEESLGS